MGFARTAGAYIRGSGWQSLESLISGSFGGRLPLLRMRAQVDQQLNHSLPCSAVAESLPPSLPTASARACWPGDREPSVDRAHIFGVFQSISRREARSDRIAIAHPDQQILAQTAETLERLGLRSPSENRGTPKVLEVYAEGLAGYLRAETADNTHLPWRFLGSRAERLAFLKGYFLHSGAVSGKFFRLESSHGESLCIHLACLLGELGVASTVYATSRGTLLQLSATEELCNLDALDILRGELKEDLRMALASPQHARRIKWRDAYTTAISQKGESSVAEIAREVSVAESTVAGWLSGASPPKSVQRMLEIDRLRRAWKVPFADSMAILYLEKGLDLDISNHLARIFSPTSLRQHLDSVLSHTQRAGIRISADVIESLLLKRQVGQALPC